MTKKTIMIALIAVTAAIAGNRKYAQDKKKEQIMKKESEYRESIGWAINHIKDPLSVVKKTQYYDIGDIDLYEIMTKKSYEKIIVIMDWGVNDSVVRCMIYAERWNKKTIMCRQKDKKILEKILLRG